MKYKLLLLLLLSPALSWANPVDSLLERLDKGASSKFELIVDGAIDNTDDYFELSDSHGSIATGIGWYLRYWAGIDVAWNNMHPRLPRRLPKVETTVRHTSKATWRYYLNYCTLSYSMAFWDWDRWQEPTPFGTHCCNGWATAGRRHGSSLPVLPSRHGG